MNDFETPVMGAEVDVTALLPGYSDSVKRAKRKRSSTAVISQLKPILKGSLIRNSESGKVVWSGCWGLIKGTFREPFGDNIIRAPFYFERTSTLPSDTATDSSKDVNLIQDGYFSGYFSMQDLTNKESTTFIKHFENDILLRFVKLTSGDEIEVLGSGQNKFGKFLIEGILNTNTNEVNCARNYLPNKLNTPCKRNKNILSGQMLSPKSDNIVKRSSRQRTPTMKYKESMIMGEIKIKSPKLSVSTVQEHDFNGRMQLIELINGFESDIPEIEVVLNDLRNKKCKSLKNAITRIESIISSADSHKQLIKSLSEFNHKINSKIEEKIEEEEYISMFDNVADIEEVDPLSINPAAKLPEIMKSPTLIDLSHSFERSAILFKEQKQDEGEIETDEEEYDCEQELDLADIDYSDLTFLDAETLKELNEFVEFSCPSKGA